MTHALEILFIKVPGKKILGAAAAAVIAAGISVGVWRGSGQEPVVPSTPNIIGVNSPGQLAVNLSLNYKRAGRFAVSQDFTINRVCAYIDGNGPTTPGTQNIRYNVSADSSNNPGALLAQTSDIAVTSGQVAGFVCAPLAADLVLTTGNYWLGIHSGETATVGRFYYNTVVGAEIRFGPSDNFADGSANPWGTPAGTDPDRQLAIYADFQEITPPPPPPPPPPTPPNDIANLWVIPSDTPNGSCTRSAALETLASAQAAGRHCNPNDDTTNGAFNAAYRSASDAGGDLILVMGGTYGATQSLVRDSGKDNAAVTTIRVAPGQAVTTAGLFFGAEPDNSECDTTPISRSGADNVVVDGDNRMSPAWLQFMCIGGDPTENVTVKNMKVGIDGAVFIKGAIGITMQNVEIGPVCCTADGIQMTRSLPNFDPNNILLDGLYVHDIVRVCSEWPANAGPCPQPESPTAHTDGIQVGSGHNVTIRNSRWYAIPHQQIFFNCINGGSFSNITIENNMAAEKVAAASNEINLSDTCVDQFTGFIHVKYNSTEGTINVRPAGVAPGTDVQIIGNIGNDINCISDPDYQFAYNVRDVACGFESTETVVSSIAAQFLSVDDFAPNLHLASTSGAINAGNPADFPSVDVDGELRPLPAGSNENVDAGADEVTGASLLVTTSGNDTTCARGNLALPCLTLNKAYSLAQCGDLIEIDGGSYPSATVVDAGKSCAGNRIRAYSAPGEIVTMTVTVTSADDLIIDGTDGNAENPRFGGTTNWVGDFNVNTTSVPTCVDNTSTIAACPRNVEFRGVKGTTGVNGARFDVIGPTRNITFAYSQFGPVDDDCTPGGTNTSGGNRILPVSSLDQSTVTSPRDTFVHHSYFYFYQADPATCAPGAYVDCLHFYAHVHVEFTNNIVTRCEAIGFLLNSNGAGAENDLIQNNWFGPTISGSYGFKFRGTDASQAEDYDSIEVSYNSCVSLCGPATEQPPTLSNISWKANIQSSMGTSCLSGVAYAKNITTSSTTECATGLESTAGAVCFASTALDANLDLSLCGTSSARGFADTVFPATDIDDEARPQGSADAGADEIP